MCPIEFSNEFYKEIVINAFKLPHFNHLPNKFNHPDDKNNSRVEVIDINENN